MPGAPLSRPPSFSTHTQLALAPGQRKGRGLEEDLWGLLESTSEGITPEGASRVPGSPRTTKIPQGRSTAAPAR